jgi:hypothetical protein
MRVERGGVFSYPDVSSVFFLFGILKGFEEMKMMRFGKRKVRV